MKQTREYYIRGNQQDETEMTSLSRSNKNPEVLETGAWQDKDRRKEKNDSGRKCQICGKNPYPNYFFCRSCHNRLEAYEE